MKTRVIACENYMAECDCKKGRKGTFWKECQKCGLYKPLKGGRPVRQDLRNKKDADFRRRDFRKALQEV